MGVLGDSYSLSVGGYSLRRIRGRKTRFVASVARKSVGGRLFFPWVDLRQRTTPHTKTKCSKSEKALAGQH